MIASIWVVFGIILLTQLGNVLYLRRRAPAVAIKRPLVSILVPARNEEQNLRRLLPSLLMQQYESFEVIIYDDDSDDDTSEMLRGIEDARLKVLRGTGPPPGWVGKVHALYEAEKEARGELYLFLDADAELLDPTALERLVAQRQALGAGKVLTGFVDLRGGGMLLVSILPHTILSFLPAFLAERIRAPSLGALNGQCWMIDADVYRRLAPHERVAGEVLEDVKIGRFLMRHGITPVMVNVRREVAVHMYDGFVDAWRGFRKNAYLLLGGSPITFALWFVFYEILFVVGPILYWPFLVVVYVLKFITDRVAGMPWWVTLLGPISYAAAWVLQLDSAHSHWTGRATWKGRRVS